MINLWEQYYRGERITPLLKQEPYYRYFLESYADGITHGMAADEVVNIVLGGAHPKYTHPLDVADIGRVIFPNRRLSTTLVDMNPACLSSIKGEGFTKILSTLESLPPHLDQIHLLFLDFTVDFMDDDKLRLFNHTIGNHLAQYGVIAMANTDPAFPIFQRHYTRMTYGVENYYRSQSRVAKILSNLQPLVVAEADHHVRISFW